MARIDFAIVGVPKSATTFVHQELRAHPDVTMGEEENTAFHRASWRAEIGPLLSMAERANRRLCGLKRPDMIFSAEVLSRLREHNPEIKAIVVLRNPAERTIAHYFHLMKLSYLPLREFAAALPSILSGEILQDWPRCAGVLGNSRYRSALENCISILGRDNLHIALHDDVKRDAEGVMSAMCGFLGLPYAGPSSKPEERLQKVIYSLERQRFLRHRNEVVMELDEFGRAQRIRRTPKTDIEREWLLLVSKFDETVLARATANVPPRLSAGDWEKLYAFFREDIAYTESVLGRAIPAWHANPLA